MEVDGTYAMVASGVKGCATAVVSIRDGKLQGWDFSGSRYEGNCTVENDEAVFDLIMTLPPNHFLIWGTATFEGWQTRHIEQRVPLSHLRTGEPYLMTREQLWIAFSRVPDGEHAEFAGPDGFRLFVERAQEILDEWRRRPL